MKQRFRLFATWVAITGLLMGVAYGAGVAQGKAAPAQSGTSLTAQQVQQMLGGGSSGSGTTPQQAPGGGLGPPPGP